MKKDRITYSVRTYADILGEEIGTIREKVADPKHARDFIKELEPEQRLAAQLGNYDDLALNTLLNLAFRFDCLFNEMKNSSNLFTDSEVRRFMVSFFVLYQRYVSGGYETMTDLQLADHFLQILIKYSREDERIATKLDIPPVTIGHELEYVDTAYTQIEAMISTAFDQLVKAYNRLQLDASISLGEFEDIINNSGMFLTLLALLSIINSNQRIKNDFSIKNLRMLFSNMFDNSIACLGYKDWMPFIIHAEGSKNLELVSSPALDYRVLIRELVTAYKLKIISNFFCIHITVGGIKLSIDNLDAMYLLPNIIAAGFLSIDSLNKIFGEEFIDQENGELDVDAYLDYCERSGDYIAFDFQEKHEKPSLLFSPDLESLNSKISYLLPFHRAKNKKFDMADYPEGSPNEDFIEFRGIGNYRITELKKMARVYRYIQLAAFCIAANQKEEKSKAEDQLSNLWIEHKNKFFAIMAKAGFRNEDGSPRKLELKQISSVYASAEEKKISAATLLRFIKQYGINL